MPFKPGQSGNPLGRKQLSDEVKAAIASNASAAVKRMATLLSDDTAFGKEGWLPGKDQITLLEKAMDRGYGKSESLSISHSHSHSGTIEAKAATPMRPSLKTVQDQLPEKKAQTQIIDAKVVGDEG